MKARRGARRDLLKYIEAIKLEAAPDVHHRLLISKLQEIEDGKLKNLMVFMPPGSAKSTYASILFPSHYLGRFTNQKLIGASYEQGLATRFGRAVRNITEQDEYRRIFHGAGLTKDSKAKGEWELQNGSSYYGCGVGSGVTGRRADGVIIDDPVKGSKEADSEVVRQTAKDWYETDLTTRMKPNAWQVIIQTRWHEDDLAGWILPDDWDGESGWIDCGDKGDWYVICLPAEARENDPLGREPGEWLWPNWFTPDWWEKTKASKTPRVWGSLYQQTPTPDEGTYFKREWFWRYDKAPEVRKYITADFAVTDEAEADDPDYTEIGVHGTVKEDTDDGPITKLYLGLDGWTGRKDPTKWVHEYFNLVKRHKPMCEFAEVGVIRRATEGLLKQQRRQRQAHGRIEWLPHIGDKVANARALQGLAEMGQVGLPNNAYGDYLLEQLIKFPAGKYDDAVDMMALMARAIAEAHPMLMVHERKQAVKKDRYDKAFDDDEFNWKVA